MILPMMGFFLMMAVLGAILSGVASADERTRKLAPAAYSMFFAGIGVWICVFVIGGLGSLVSTEFGDKAGFLGGPVVGVLAGGLIGYYLGVRRTRGRLR